MAAGWVLEAMSRARRRLGMDTVYVVEFGDAHSVLTEAVGNPETFGLVTGMQVPFSRCLGFRFATGGLGMNMVANAGDMELADWKVEGPRTPEAWVAASLRTPTGQPYGVLLGLSTRPRSGLGGLDAEMLSFVADLIARGVADRTRERAVGAEKSERIGRAVAGETLRIAYQPIVDLNSGATIAVEALSRFDDTPVRPPNLWFAEAAQVGLGVDLELAAASRALAGLSSLPAGIDLTINISPSTVLTGRLPDVITDDLVARRLVFELTEHTVVTDYDAIRAAFEPLRRRGVRLAVDDLGAGASGLPHLTGLRPEIIKLDANLVRRAEIDRYYDALLHAMVAYGDATSAALIGEGIEQPEHVDGLRRNRIGLGQGYLFTSAVESDRISDFYEVPANGSAGHASPLG